MPLLSARPPRLKNRSEQRDLRMHSTKQGNRWYVGMKTYVGADSHTELIHSVVVTAAHVHDSQVLADLLHGGETRLWGDSAYTGHGEMMRE